jgi:hypothetical protein
MHNDEGEVVAGKFQKLSFYILKRAKRSSLYISNTCWISKFFRCAAFKNSAYGQIFIKIILNMAQISAQATHTSSSGLSVII